MASVIVNMGESAFMSILGAAIESFPSKYQGGRKPAGVTPEGEVYGLLFGQKLQRRNSVVFNVAVVTMLQMLREKSSSSILASEHHEKRAKVIIEAFPWLQFLGTCHSHPYHKAKFSRHSTDFSRSDRYSACDLANEHGEEVLEVIVALTYLSKKIGKEPIRECSATTGYCGNFKYILTCYITERQSRRLNEVENLICPIAAAVGNYDFLT